MGAGSLVIDHLTVSRAAAGLGVSWHTANAAILTEGKRRLIDDPGRFQGGTAMDGFTDFNTETSEELPDAVPVPFHVVRLTEAINGRLEHVRGSERGFRNLTNYIARSLLESGGFRTHLDSQLR